VGKPGRPGGPSERAVSLKTVWKHSGWAAELQYVGTVENRMGSLIVHHPRRMTRAKSSATQKDGDTRTIYFGGHT